MWGGGGVRGERWSGGRGGREGVCCCQAEGKDLAAHTEKAAPCHAPF